MTEALRFRAALSRRGRGGHTEQQADCFPLRQPHLHMDAPGSPGGWARRGQLWSPGAPGQADLSPWETDPKPRKDSEPGLQGKPAGLIEAPLLGAMGSIRSKLENAELYRREQRCLPSPRDCVTCQYSPLLSLHQGLAHSRRSINI